jgi:hypothetical protein
LRTIAWKVAQIEALSRMSEGPAHGEVLQSDLGYTGPCDITDSVGRLGFSGVHVVLCLKSFLNSRPSSFLLPVLAQR